MYIWTDQNQLTKVEAGFPVNHLDLECLLENWRWLCPASMRLIARNAFGDLFLCDELGQIHCLDVSGGKIDKVTDSEEQFRACLQVNEFREEWLAEADEQTAALRGLVPNADQCIAFAIPAVFKEACNPYIIDLYECVSFLGDLHQQLLGLPNGAQVRLIPGSEA